MSKSLFTTKNDNNMFIVLTILIFVLVSDTMISQVSDLLAPQLVSDFSIALFYVFVVIFGITHISSYDILKERSVTSMSSPRQPDLCIKSSQ